MADTITLGDLTEALIWEAGIDGKTGANARHTLERLYELIGRKYKQLRSLATQHGEDFFRTPGTAAPIPARASGEDWIELPYPTDASEIVSVDVQSGGQWFELTKSSWAQRRVHPQLAHRLDAVGEWTTLRMPQPSADTVTTGAIAIWPYTLSGNYKIDIVPHWVPLTDPAHVMIVFPHWEEWLLCACTQVILQRDNNKRAAFVDAAERLARAEAQIITHARRSKRGVIVARRRDGFEL